VDGLLESRENRERIVALDSTLMAPAPAALLTFCARYHMTWLLAPRAAVMGSAAKVSGNPVAGALARFALVPAAPLTMQTLVPLVETNNMTPPD
jgi:hypothetical protein